MISQFSQILARNKKLLGIPASRILRLLNEDKMAASTSSRVCSSSMFLMKWNGIMESFLIDEVEKLPYLWNPWHPHFTKRLKKKIRFQQIAMRMSERWPALEAFFTPEVEQVQEIWFPSGNTSLASSSLMILSNHLIVSQILDNMELEVNATSLNVSDEDLFENVVELPPIPNRAPSQSELPQRIRVFTSTPVSTSTPHVTTSTPRAKKRKVESSQEAFYESMQKCLRAVGKKTVNETFASFIASELDNLPCPKQQVAVRRKLCATLLECLE
ncbi:hypothetical protein TNCV_238931 [Trichonephila clavipes]|nr:hypothetical protein TNCV_238931 [Trichonephila clavipes]